MPTVSTFSAGFSLRLGIYRLSGTPAKVTPSAVSVSMAATSKATTLAGGAATVASPWAVAMVTSSARAAEASEAAASSETAKRRMVGSSF